MYNATGTGKYTHEIRLKPEFEDRLAALMIEKNQSVNEAIESAIRTAFNQYSQVKRDELLEQVKQPANR
jgi:predicted DNA-binding protein